MNWGVVAGITLIGALLIGRTRLQGWIIDRWAAGQLSDRSAKALLAGVMFGPILVAGAWVAAVAGFPWSLVVLVVFVVSVVPAIGLANATFDYHARHLVKQRKDAR